MKSLIVAPAWVGDMVMAHCLIRVLTGRDPDARIELVAPPATAPVAGRMAGVDAVHLLDVPHGVFGPGHRWALARSLRGGGFEQAFVLPNSWKSALVPALARIPRRVGFRGEMRHGLLTDVRRLDRERLGLMIERFTALAVPPSAPLPDPVPRPRLEQDTAAAASLRRDLHLEDPAPVLACCPGAEFGPAKQWPMTHFAALAERRLEAGWQVWLMGGPGDRQATAAIVEAVPQRLREGVHDLAGRTRLTEAIDLLGEADAVVTNDSGLMHVACALQRPVVALYGSTSPGFTPPLGERVASLSLDLPCAPCFQRTCPLGHRNCLVQLEPARVDAALTALLEGGPPVRAG